MPITFIIHFEAKKENLEDFINLMTAVKKDLPRIDGCIDVSIFKSITEPHNFTLIETWESQKHHRQHINYLVESGSWAHISTLLEKEARSGYFNEQLEKSSG